MIPSFKHGIIASSGKKAAVIPDVTPNAVNWSNIFYDGVSPSQTYLITSKQITGINQTITLRLNYSLQQLGVEAAEIWYKIAANGNNEGVWSNDTNLPTSGGYTKVFPNGTFTVNNNDYVEFIVVPNANYFGSIPASTVTVVNVTDSNTTIDTFTAEASG